MGLSEHTIFWHVYPLGFTGAPVRPASDAERARLPRLRHVEGWLDHLIGLGCNGLLLGPVFESSTHGYDTLDHFRIDPRLGGLDDFDHLIAAARERGVAVVLDGVFNHVGAEHPLYRAALASADAPENELFGIDWSSGRPRARDFEGHGSLVALDHSQPAVEHLVADVMTHWLARGVAGWRLDAAYAVPAEFWARVLPRVRAQFPDAWFLGEMIHGDYVGYVAASGLDSVTQYELWKAVWSSLRDGNFFELDHALTRHNEFLEAFVPQTFVGNHDVTRIATRVGEPAAVLGAVLLFTVGGTPSVYYGDEVAAQGLKLEDWGGDDQVRGMYPSTPAELPASGAAMLRAHTELIGLRRRHPWLVRARTRALQVANTAYSYEAVGPDGQRMRVDLSLDAAGPAATVSDASGTLWSTAG